MWERNIDWLPPVHTWARDLMCLDWGLNPQPRYVPWPGTESVTFWLWDDAPTNSEPHLLGPNSIFYKHTHSSPTLFIWSADFCTRHQSNPTGKVSTNAVGITGHSHGMKGPQFLFSQHTQTSNWRLTIDLNARTIKLLEETWKSIFTTWGFLRT